MSTLFSHFFAQNNEIRPQESDFTEVLSTIVLVPKMLYFYGKIPQKRLKSVAIVGTRKPTKYGLDLAYELAYAVAQRGAVVVSGLAFGIDAAAHRGALDAGGVTVAVLGTPIDYIYPRGNEGLAREIVERGGAILSELPPGARYHPRACFLRRNRLISGLADVVVIPEAAERSGSLNTAAHALEQGREVFAAPGDVSRLTSRGCNRLIRQGAIPYLEPADVLEVLFPDGSGSAGALGDSGGVVGSANREMTGDIGVLKGDTALETAVLQLLATGVDGGEVLVEGLQVPVSELNQTLTLLEIKGRIVARGANRWRLKR